MVLKIVYYLYLFLSGVSFFLLGEWTFHTRKRKWINYVIAFIITVFALSIYKIIPYINLVIFPFWQVTVYCILFGERLGLRLIHFIEMYVLESAVEGFCVNIVEFCLAQYLEVEWIYLFGSILTIILFRFITVAKWYKRTMEYLASLTVKQYISIAGILMGGFTLLGGVRFIQPYLTNILVGKMMYVVSTVELMLVFIGVVWFIREVYNKEYYYKQNRLKEEIIDTQQKYVQLLYEKDQEIRRFRHDIASQLGCLSIFLENGDLTSAQRHLTNMEKEFEKTVAAKFHIGNEVLDVILNQMYVKAQGKNINLSVDGVITDFKEINTYDLCTIFSNALLNAIEACDVVENVEKNIRVTLVEHGNTLLCRFSNPATQEMYNATKESRTTKRDDKNHGFGVRNIYSAVENNGGEAVYLYENGELILEIYL